MNYCIHTFTHTNTHICTHTYIQTNTHKCIHESYMYARVPFCERDQALLMYTPTGIHTYKGLYTHTKVYDINIYVCIPYCERDQTLLIYTHILIYTCLYTHIQVLKTQTQMHVHLVARETKQY